MQAIFSFILVVHLGEVFTDVILSFWLVLLKMYVRLFIYLVSGSEIKVQKLFKSEQLVSWGDVIIVL